MWSVLIVELFIVLMRRRRRGNMRKKRGLEVEEFFIVFVCAFIFKDRQQVVNKHTEIRSGNSNPALENNNAEKDEDD